MGRRLGLIIGVNNYQDTAFRPLHYAENDARALAQWLVNVKGGAWSPGDVQLVLGTHVTKELIESLITQLCLTMAEPGDLVFIYFAGHTFLDERSGNGYLALANTQYREPSTALHLLSFATQVMTRCQATHMLVMLDSFQTGPLWQTRRSTPYDARPLFDPSLLNVLQQQGNRLFLCSCRGNEQAPEAGEHNLGLLMHRMIVGLSGPARDPSTGQVSLQSVYNHLQQTLGDQQRPQPFGQERTPLILVGDIAPIPPQQAPSPANPPSGIFGSSGLQRSGLFKQPQGPQAATLQASPPPASFIPEPSSGSSPEQLRQSQYLVSQAQQLVLQQQYTEALSLVEQALLITPQATSALTLQEQIQDNRGRFPQETSALTLKAQILGTIGRFPEALAVVDQLLQFNANNPLTWSMRAALLNNMGRYQEALAAIERSHALDPNNSETYAIQNNIMEKMAATSAPGSGHLQKQRDLSVAQPSDNTALSFLMSSTMQILGFLTGIAGILLPALVNHLPTTIGALLTGIGTALLYVCAARGPYRHGWAHLLPAFLISVIAIGIIVFGGLLNLVVTSHTPTNTLLLSSLRTHPTLIIPIFILGIWLVATAITPPILALGGLIAGNIAKARRKKQETYIQTGTISA